MVVLNIIRNTLRFILMAMVRQYVENESQPVLHAPEQKLQTQEFAAY